MADPFQINDKRHSARQVTASGLFTGNADAEMRRLRRDQGFVLPTSGTQARIEAKRMVTAVQERGTVADVQNRAMMAAMRQDRLQRTSARSSTGSMTRTAANTQMVLPKVRQPLASLMDKGIPFNVQDPDELMELRRWCRLFFATHPLVPLLIEIYSKFPVMGLEFVAKDPEIERFYTEMFMNDLDYEDFLPNGLLREYFMVGEVTALAHFNEELGIWSSEEIINPDMIRVSKSLFVEQERVQLMVKELVEALRNGPSGMSPSEETPSEKYERSWEYTQLVRHYPEIIKAASQEDGLDISDALVSRMVNKAAWWDLRGTPHLLRSFRTLMLEESLNAAQDAVCDRLYAPMILATLGIENMGDGECWIPDQGELEDLRDDIQSALAADFKLLCHNFGLQVTSVFGRESVPRFDTDYDRVDAQLMQAWGIGQGLIMGGSGDTYAGTAINREVCEQLMKDAQRKVVRHLRKRMEVVSEAQEFYDFELKGGKRVPIYETVVEEDEDGEEYTVRVPKLLLPDVKFACVVPGTQVLTSAGPVSVESIQPGDEVLAWNGTEYVMDHASHTGIQYRDNLVEVVTKTGKTVRCTDDHPFWTQQGWVLARDLDGHLIRSSFGQLSAQIDSADDVDLCRFLGLLVGDGNYSTTHVALSVSDPEVETFAIKMAARFGLEAHRKVDKRTEKVWTLGFSRPWKGTKGQYALRNPLHTLLREQGVWGQNGHTKRVPALVWQSGEKGRAAFLAGYLDADGTVADTQITLSSVNRVLLDDCQILFESLGIRATVRSYEYHYESQKAPERPQKLNYLHVSNKHYLRMASDLLIPLITHKAEKLAAISVPATQGRKEPIGVDWDSVVTVRPIGGGDIVTLGIADHHTHITAGLVSHNTLNLRDEATERNFVSQLKQLGVPISDKTLAINIPFEFDQELERQAQETVDKGLAQAEAMHVLQELCDAQDYAYPAELAQHLMATLQVRQGLAQTTAAEDQVKQLDQQIAQASPAGMMGLLPGTTMQPLAGSGAVAAPGDPSGGATPGAAPQAASDAAPGATADPTLGQGAPMAGDPSQLAPGQLTATMHGPRAKGPHANPPGGEVLPPEGTDVTREIPKNRQRPEESDEMRYKQPKQGRRLPPTDLPGRGRVSPRDIAKTAHKLRSLNSGPSSYRRSRLADQSRVERAVLRRQMRSVRDPSAYDLVHDPNFWSLLHAQAYENQIVSDWPEIVGGGAPESAKLLNQLLEEYESITGVRTRGF